MNLLDTTRGRKLLFCVLYASEGAPIGYVWWALPTKLRAAGIPIERVTQITALLVLPWAFKFLWAPLIDTLRSPRWGLRSWIVAAQLAMGLALAPLLTVNISDSLGLVTVCLFAHAVLAATQDASIDALCIATVPTHERGSVNGWMQLGMLSTRAVFGGAILYLEQYVGERAALGALVACVWLSTLLVLLYTTEPVRSAGAPGTFHGFAGLLGRTLRRWSTWLGLGFAATAGAGFEAVGATAHSFLLDQGATKENVGAFYAIPVIICMSLGALAGGRASDRWGRVSTTVGSMSVMAGTVILLGILHGRGLAPAFTALALLYVLIGAFTAASYALLMDLAEPAVAATQFSAFMGATNLCESWAALTVGVLIARTGYPAAFTCMALASLVAVPLAFAVRFRRS